MVTRKMTVNQNIYFGVECTRLVHYWAAEKIKMADPIEALLFIKTLCIIIIVHYAL